MHLYDLNLEPDEQNIESDDETIQVIIQPNALDAEALTRKLETATQNLVQTMNARNTVRHRMNVICMLLNTNPIMLNL
jgi:hypothetical protein